MPRMKTEKLTIWGAVGEDGKILVSSISAYRAVALRWAQRYRNHHIEQLCNVPRVVEEEKNVTMSKNEYEDGDLYDHVAIPAFTQQSNVNGATVNIAPVRKKRGRPMGRKVRGV